MESSESTNINIQTTEIGGVSFPSGSTLTVEYVNGKKEGAGKDPFKEEDDFGNCEFS